MYVCLLVCVCECEYVFFVSVCVYVLMGGRLSRMYIDCVCECVCIP